MPIKTFPTSQQSGQHLWFISYWNDYRDFYRDEIQCGINNIQHAVKNAKNTYMSDALLMAGSICISVAQLGIPPELAPVASLASGALGAPMSI